MKRATITFLFFCIYLAGCKISEKEAKTNAKTAEAPSSSYAMEINPKIKFKGKERWAGVEIKSFESKALELAIPPNASVSQMKAIESLKQYGSQKNINVIIKVIK